MQVNGGKTHKTKDNEHTQFFKEKGDREEKEKEKRERERERERGGGEGGTTNEFS